VNDRANPFLSKENRKLDGNNFRRIRGFVVRQPSQDVVFACVLAPATITNTIAELDAVVIFGRSKYNKQIFAPTHL
jgi:hypothetical protein